MSFETLQQLTDREKAVLRLFARGHDAKSTARQLGISLHAVNERLRTTRRKLGVSSSREAARLLASSERQGPNSFVDEKIEVAPSDGLGDVASQNSKGGKRLSGSALGGICTMLVIAVAMLVASASQVPVPGPLPNWSLQRALPRTPIQPKNQIYLSGNRLMWNGDDASEENIRSFLGVVARMSPQPLTILSYGSHVVPGRVQQTRRLVDDILHCKPATCVEITTAVNDDPAAPELNSSR